MDISSTSHSIHIVIANILSLCTIAICFVSKIPQIQTVVSNKSAKGKFSESKDIYKNFR